jgi:hypothetical protein
MPGKVEPADGGRKERQVVAVAALGAGQALDERRLDAPVLDGGRHRARHVEEREEIGLGEELAEDFEAALAAPHAGEPVVDQGNS